MRRYLLTLALLCVSAAAYAASLTLPSVTFTTGSTQGPYSAWTNYPQAPSFFPISVWLQNPTDTNYGTFGTNAAAAAATKINTYLSPYPSLTSTTLAPLTSRGLFAVPQINTGAGKTPSNAGTNSISSLLAIPGAPAAVIGWNMGDEPQTGSCTQWPMSALPSQIATIQGYDPTRPVLLNSTDYIFNSGACSPQTLNTNYMAALSVGSFDEYPITNPWSCTGTSCGSPRDALWMQGWTINQMMAVRPAGAPMWAFVESGTDDLGFSSQDGNTCNATTNLCTPRNNEMRATPEQVNAEVWLSVINGATGIEWFCHDTTGVGLCMGEGGGALATSIQQNLTYVNTQLLAFAPQINAATVGQCTMITGTSFSSFKTSCSGGILSLGTGNASMPANALIKSYGGAHYVFVQPARNGTGPLSITLAGDAGKTATVVYDSDAQYDAANSNVGKTIALDANGQFADTFGANGDNYQVKIYTVQ